MKTSPSAEYLRLARSTFKAIERRAYFRKTSSLSSALDSGAWVEATSRLAGVPDALAQIEYALGQFTADSIQLTGKNIEWWDANLFDALASEYIECKIELRLGEDAQHLAADKIYYFSGYVDKRTISPSETDDSYTFTVDTADVIADRMLGEFISTQYYDEIKGGVALFKVPGVYVVTANTGTNPLAAGIHTVGYQYNDGTQQARLDDGDWVSITADGEYVLGNGRTGVTETEQIRVRVYTSELVQDNAERSDELIVRTSPVERPFVWYSGVSLRSLLRAIYTKIGVNCDTLNLTRIDTEDGSLRMSMLEFVADGAETLGTSMAIAAGGAGVLYVANANNVYKLDPATGICMLACSVDEGHRISRMIYNARTKYLWILHGAAAGTKYGGSLARYNAESEELNGTASVTTARYNNIELFDFFSAGAGRYEYCLLYTDADNGSVMRVDGGTMAVTTLFSRAGLGYTGGYGPTLKYAYQGITGTEHFYRFQAITAGGNVAHAIGFDDEGDEAWGDRGATSAIPFAHEVGAYDAVAGLVYGVDLDASAIKSYDTGGADHETVYELPAGDEVNGLYHDGESLYFSTARDRQAHRYDGATLQTFGIPAFTLTAAYVTTGGATYGVDNVGRVFMISDEVELFLDTCKFGGKTMKGALTDALRACNCVGTISAAKKAIVYTRGDADGNPVTSGNSIDITVRNAEDISRDSQFGQAFDLVEIDNGEVKENYNGSAFNVMPSTLDERVLSIQNAMIHASVVRDYLVMFHQYFKTARTLYTIDVPQAMFHLEPMDAANVTFDTTKIKVTATNKPIYAAAYTAEDGTMQLGVLI